MHLLHSLRAGLITRRLCRGCVVLDGYGEPKFNPQEAVEGG